MGVKRRRPVGPLKIALAVVVVPLLLLGTGLYLYERHWRKKVEKRARDLKREGRLLSYERLLNRGQGEFAPGPRVEDLRGAFGSMEEGPSAYAVRALAVRPVGVRPSEESLDVLRTRVEDNRRALAAIREAARRPGSGYPLEWESSPYMILMNHAADVRSAGRLCLDEAYLRAADGDAEEAVRSLLAARGVAESLGRRCFPIEMAVRIAVDRILCDKLERVLGLVELPARDLDRLRRALAREQSQIHLYWPMVAAISSTHYTYEHFPPPEVWLEAVLGENFRTQLAAFRWMPGRLEKGHLFALNAMDRMVDLARLPIAERDIEAEKEPLRRAVEAAPELYSIPRGLLPGYRAFEMEAEGRARLAVARAALSVEQWRTEQGRWPESLEGAALPGALPKDPFTGEALRYGRTEHGVVVYSVGADEVDNGGISQGEARQRGDADDEWDIPFRLLDPERRGAEQWTFAREAEEAGLAVSDLEQAGFRTEELKELGVPVDELPIR